MLSSASPRRRGSALLPRRSTPLARLVCAGVLTCSSAVCCVVSPRPLRCFSSLPRRWRCPRCSASLAVFRPLASSVCTASRSDGLIRSSTRQAEQRSDSSSRTTAAQRRPAHETDGATQRWDSATLPSALAASLILFLPPLFPASRPTLEPCGSATLSEDRPMRRVSSSRKCQAHNNTRKRMLETCLDPPRSLPLPLQSQPRSPPPPFIVAEQLHTPLSRHAVDVVAAILLVSIPWACALDFARPIDALLGRPCRIPRCFANCRIPADSTLPLRSS